jgi:hypothetical protein
VDIAPVVVRHRQPRLDLERAVEIRQRRIEIALEPPRLSAIVVGFREAGARLDRARVVRNGSVQVAPVPFCVAAFEEAFGSRVGSFELRGDNESENAECREGLAQKCRAHVHLASVPATFLKLKS